MRNYWCYRIDTNRLKFFMDELHNGRLRQGWGWDEKQDLRNMQMDEGAGRNRPMYRKVKRGDILLVPQLPYWGQIAIVEAENDWDKGYQFSIDERYHDFGHIFPAKYLRQFTRNNKQVSGGLRSTLKNPSRFWNINHYAKDVDDLLRAEEDELLKRQDYDSRFVGVVGEVFNSMFDETEFAITLYANFIQQFTREEWEYALTYGLKELLPFYQIERVGGKEEKKHGTDILIKMPSILEGYQYAIAIQVKDYSDVVGSHVIDQINKADEYWGSENLRLIEKWLVITKASKDVNHELIENDGGVRIIFADELKNLLHRMARSMRGKECLPLTCIQLLPIVRTIFPVK